MNASADPPVARHRVVDVCALALDRACWRTYFQDLAAVAPTYLRAFGRHAASVFGAEYAAFRARLDAGDRDGAIDLLVAGRPERTDPGDLVRTMDGNGVVHQILMSCGGTTADGDDVNDRVAAVAAKAPDRLQAWAGIDLTDPDRAVAELERCHALGMRGFAVTPFWQGTDPRDPACDPVYRRADELGMPLWLHTGHHFARHAHDLCHPRNVDHIARRHPGLPIVAGHAAWPWVLEMISIAQRHRHVYLDISSHRPPWMARPGSGWEPLLLYGATTLRDRILFGSATWVNADPVAVLAGQVAALGLGAEVTDNWLYGNAARLLGLEQH
ncbi:amidohydrolase family protein [Streptomyces sp. DSM 41921]|uniref:Amidohydrolase family protein n=1 Tax=Streptomyces dubilierae TaxID=3075533 RepID=A0ABU2PIS5_9ACTN|nr:amidohydrolase family protein [Streptomyces sp. DSM 41921]MDT0392064.1 amidohydrolase family protein [Streptomyces sp. DSM 41921]